MGSKAIRAPRPPVIRFTSASRSSSTVAMTFSAGIQQRLLVALVRVVAIGVAPTIRAIWMAARPRRCWRQPV